MLLTDVLVLCGCTSMYQLLIGIQVDNSVPVSPYTPLDDNDTIVKVTIIVTIIVCILVVLCKL